MLLVYFCKRFYFSCFLQEALDNLGLCHARGHGVTENYLEARRLFVLAETKTRLPHPTGFIDTINEKIRTECPLLGKRVVITGTSREGLNGHAGVVENIVAARAFERDHTRDRYVVKLDTAGLGRCQRSG